MQLQNYKINKTILGIGKIKLLVEVVYMNISTLVDDYAKNHSPYVGSFVNHLPMGQLALYFMTNNLQRVADYSEQYMNRSHVDPIKNIDTVVTSMDDCIGNRDLYGPLLNYLDANVNDENADEYIEYILNTYPLGMSSGLFHTLIRLAYAVEAYREDKKFLDELKRAMSYYITAYREASLFTRAINPREIISEMQKLKNNQSLGSLLEDENSMGQKLNTLYSSNDYMENGFIIQGSEYEKINAILDLILPGFTNSKGKGDILVLHCITGLHALIVLEDYFNDFKEGIDILTTCIVTYLMTIDFMDLSNIYNSPIETFDILISKGIESPDVHTIKLTYTANEIYRLYNRKDLKAAAYKRILNT